jgi:hypothetical protein
MAIALCVADAEQTLDSSAALPRARTQGICVAPRFAAAPIATDSLTVERRDQRSQSDNRSAIS